MRMYDLILKKRNGETLSSDEINFFVSGYVRGTIPDYQASALLMAIYFKGLDKNETADLTMAMAYSGDTVDLSDIKGVKVDKHSTGGVGDTTTLVVAPLVSACGVTVAKMSGRGLGHTGGTLDKLETVPGFNVHQSIERFNDIVKDIGISIIGQTGALVPADKKLYALRDVTATVDNISLIASSVMSKKIAAGADAIVLDVKVGTGSFMTTTDDAFALAKEMVEIGRLVNKKTVALVTDMNQPLGMAIGNALEVKEAIEILKGMHNDGALKEVCLELGAQMLILAGMCSDPGEGRQMLDDAINKGKGAEKLKEMIRAQGGNPTVVDDISLLPTAKELIEFKARETGYITFMDARAIGVSASLLGAGRTKKDDIIDPAVGIVMKKRIGDSIIEGQVIAEFHVNDKTKLDEAMKIFQSAISIGENKPDEVKLILGTVLNPN